MDTQAEKTSPTEYTFILLKIEKALNELDNGLFLSSEELDEEINHW